ncbi:MAG: hypothetical protein ACRC2N_09205 [Aeromonas sp.]
MSSLFSYKSDDYDRQSQRFIIPLYSKNEIGSYEFSSTGTLVKYKGSHFIIFAAHALVNGIKTEDLYTIFADGELHQITTHSVGHQVFVEEDIVIVDFFNKAFEGKNYFNLNMRSMNGFDKNHFAWIGFPASNVKQGKIHQSSTKDTLKKKFVHSDESGDYFKNARYFIITSKTIKNNNVEITGVYDRKDADLKYKGKVSMGPHPQGMSGGAMFFLSKSGILNEDIDDSFRFAGIGIEYKRDNSIVGVPTHKIIELIERFDIEHPLQLILDEYN